MYVLLLGDWSQAPKWTNSLVGRAFTTVVHIDIFLYASFENREASTALNA